MSKHFKFITTAVALTFAAALAVGLSTSTALSQKKAPFGEKEDQDYAGKLWKAMTAAKLVGKNSINTRPYEGQAPHGAILQTIDTSIKVGGHTGRLIVKRNYGPGGITINQVWSDPAKHLKAVTVMFKREKGYDKDNQDWFWVKYKASGELDKNPKGMMLAGRVAKGADKGCIACHSGADGKDYLFINDK